MKPAIFSSIVIFFTIFGISLITTNSKNLTDFNLQHMVVEAIVERRSVKLGGSYSSHLQPNGDVLTYQGNVYPIKQPGTGVLGAVSYFPFYKLGNSYYQDYLQVSSWVSIWTSSFVAGLIAVAIFYLLTQFGVSNPYASLLSIGSIICTTVLPYTGFPHHDLIAMLPLYFAIYLVLQGILTPVQKSQHDYFYLAGFLAALSLFFSILPITIVLALGIITLWKKGIYATLQFGIGTLVGIIPSLTYNYFVLGGLLHFPNLMGSSVDTIPHFNISTMIPSLLRYFTQPGLSVILFSPLSVIGLLAWLPGKSRSPAQNLTRTFVLLATLIFAIHLSSFETEGDLQYGPRYLLPLLPLWFMGIYNFIQNKRYRYALVIIAVVSFGVNILGALYGAMYKEITVFPVAHYLGKLMTNSAPIYPVRLYGIIVLITLIVGLFIAIVASNKRQIK